MPSRNERYKIRPRRYLNEYLAGQERPNKETKEYLREIFGDDWEVIDTEASENPYEAEHIIFQSSDRKRLEKLLDQMNEE